MNRREFITGLAGTATAWPLAALAQQGGGKRVSVLLPATADDLQFQPVAAFLRQPSLTSLGSLRQRLEGNDPRSGPN